jgi:hypothetical protein
MIDTNEEEKKSPEEIQVEIARLQSEKAASEAKRAEIEERQRADQAQIRQARSVETYKAAIGKTGITFHTTEPEDLTAVLKTMRYTITPSNSGDSFRVLDENNKQVPLERALEALAVKHQYLVHSGAEHLFPLRDETGAYREPARSDYTTLAAKARVISERGLKFWEEMAAQPTKKAPTSQLDAKTYSRLSLSEKSALVNEIGEAGIAEILRRR